MATNGPSATTLGTDQAAYVALPRLHRLVNAASRSLFANGHYDDAVFNAFKAVEDRVKHLSDSSDIGKRLIAFALNKNSPKLDIASPKADTYQKADEREGYMFLFMGAALGIRNPRGHGGNLNTADDEAAEMLMLASLLMRALDRAEEQLALQPAEAYTSGDWYEDGNDDDPGTLDRIVAMEEALPEIQATVEQMAVCLVKFSAVSHEYTPQIKAGRNNPSMAARLRVVRKFAEELKPPAGRFRKLAAEYVGQVVQLDSGLGAFTELHPFASMSADEQAQYSLLAGQVRRAREASIGAVDAAKTMSSNFAGVAKLSKALKTPSADLRDGVRNLESVLHYYDEWVEGFRTVGVWGDNHSVDSPYSL